MKLVALVVLCAPIAASAEGIVAPAGGRPITLSQTACGAPTGGWTLAGHALSPPTQPGSGELLVGDCAAPTRVTLVATPPWPQLERVVLAPDDGALVVGGHRLAGISLHWQSSAGAGDARCDADDECRLAVPADAHATFSWLPAGAHPGDTIYGADGQFATALGLAPARTELAMLVRPDAVIDAARGGSVVPLRHADAIAAVDCAPAACVVDGDGLLVSNVPAGAAAVSIRVRLASRVVLRRGDATESAPTLRLPVSRCPLAVVSGPPLRDVDAQTVVVELDGRCARDHLRFTAAGLPIAGARTLSTSDDRTVVALRIGRTEGDAVAIAAQRDDADAVIAQAVAPTRAPPVVHVALELAHRPVDFIPTNAAATARATSADWDGPLAVVPIAGVYSADAAGVRGALDTSGVVAMRVALHRALPTGDLEIATVADPIQRSMHEAAHPAQLLAAQAPLAELLCGDRRIAPGTLAHVAFADAEGCRLILHRERLDPADGRQHLTLDVDVTRVDGSPRAEARVTQRLVLDRDASPRTLYLRGAAGRFDRYSVRLAEDNDDLPAAQWSLVTGRGHARVYATSAIPTGLYRVSDRDHSGILTLNVGVLARATWLDSLGREGLLCAEAGVLMVGLANDTSPTGKSLTQIATVAGLGFSVPIANRALAGETSVNLHAWVEFEPSRALGAGGGDDWAFVFGPSITVGNLGADL